MVRLKLDWTGGVGQGVRKGGEEVHVHDEAEVSLLAPEMQAEEACTATLREVTLALL